MQFIVKRDVLLKSLNFVQGIVEKKNTLPILSNVLLELKDKKLSIVATDLDIIFYDEINDVQGWTDVLVVYQYHDIVSYVFFNLVLPASKLIMVMKVPLCRIFPFYCHLCLKLLVEL